MRNKFTHANSPGYHPVRKVKVVFAGLSFAVRHDFSVAYKVVVSLVLVVGSAALQRWVDFGGDRPGHRSGVDGGVVQQCRGGSV